MRFVRALVMALGAIACHLPAATATTAAAEVSVYSNREAQFVAPLLRVFEGLTGHRVTFVYTADLAAKLEQEGAASKADLLIASEFSQLVHLKQQGVTKAVKSEVLADRVPHVYRDRDGHWYGLTRRARVLVTRKGWQPSGIVLSRYEDLASPAVRGRVCIRSGKHPYNLALVASLLAHNGPQSTERWLKDVQANLARKPTGGDRDQVLAVHAGLCDVALVNSYYIPAMLKSDQPAMRDAARNVDVLLPNAGDRGTHVTISGMAMAKNARNAPATLLLMDFLTSRPAVRIFSLDNEEYPVLEDQKASALLDKWGQLEPEDVPLDRLAQLMPAAATLVEKLRFDDGPTN